MSKPEESLFDWLVFLNSQPTENEWRAAGILSGSWNTCPSAQADIPRDKAGVPRDYILFQLGNAFNTLVKERNTGAAKGMLGRIKERLAFVASEDARTT